MKRDCGDIKSKLWLIGDSEPSNNSEKLENPLDLRHPTVHNIVTPIFEQIQDDLFPRGKRIDWNKLYIRNAMKQQRDWDNIISLNEEIRNFKILIDKYSPIIIIPFGAKAFEFVRRALGEEEKKFNAWNTCRIGNEFAVRCKGFNVDKQNIIPLLHACICRGNYLEAHKNFCEAIESVYGIDEENYFIATGKILSSLMIDNENSFNFWKTIDLI